MSRQLGNFAEPGDAITVGRLKLGEFGYIACQDVSVKDRVAYINRDVRVARRGGKEAIRVRRVERGCDITFVGFSEHRWLTGEPAPDAIEVLKITSGAKSYNSWHSRLHCTSVADIPIGSTRHVLRVHVRHGPQGWTVQAGMATFARRKDDMVTIRRPAVNQYEMRLTPAGRWQPLSVES
ncbi:MAG TPA: hypothetical protein VFZ48_05420 [Candidatus Saccharimonadales bacterium]